MIEQITLKVARNVRKLSADNGKQLNVIFLISQVTIATINLRILTGHVTLVSFTAVFWDVTQRSQKSMPTKGCEGD